MERRGAWRSSDTASPSSRCRIVSGSIPTSCRATPPPTSSQHHVDYVEVHDDRDPVPVSASAETATTAPAGGGDAPIESPRITASFLGSEAGRAPRARGHVRSRSGISPAKPAPRRHARPELPREGDRNREKWRRAEHRRSVDTRSLASERRAHLAHAEPDDRPRDERSPHALHPARRVRRRCRHRHHPDRRHGRGVGGTRHLGERQQRGHRVRRRAARCDGTTRTPRSPRPSSPRMVAPR